ncbi:response regulator [Actinomadura viridis]|uniref:Transcriptional regulatory protein n=1 Tax=Actinomadura viridis TaxID=58110 RepID=A0A931GNE5_9ACTN|nr:response regulator [Actinomadura viridis]MBG6092885.1 response regulator of citrate/malate metabolism [Actinomadura viridis]
MIEVLVVDDDFMVTKVNSGFVDRVEGFRVIGTAGSGEEALARIGDLNPDLVLLDLYLPDLFGLEVISRMRAAGHDCDVIVISAAREAGAVRAAARQGVGDYLLKPFGADDLRARLERYAARRADQDATVISDQTDVDRLLARSGPPAVPVLPKGMSVETAELVKRALRAADGTMSATECAAEVGLSRVSARRYLEWLASAGQAQVTLRYGAAGRPERRYRWHRPA